MIYVLLAVFAALQIADIATTLRALKLNPGAREANPVMRWFMARFGMLGGLVVPKLVVSAFTISALLYAYASNPIVALAALGLVCAAYAYVVLHNWRQV